jgi:hypothetical protein
MRECGVEGDLAGDGIFVMIGNRGAVLNFTPAWCGAGDVEKRTE